MGLKRVRNRRDDAVTQVCWRELEELLGRHYEGRGFHVEHVGTGGTDARYDGGIDLKLRRADEYILVQVKHWNAYKVPHNDVHQLLGVMVNEGATGAILVTSGEFTAAAIDAANRHGRVRLVDGNELRSTLGAEALAAVESGSGRADEFVRTMSGSAREHPPAKVRYGSPAGRASRAWSAVAVVGFLIFVLLIMGVLKKTEGTAGAAKPLATDAALAAPDTIEEEPPSQQLTGSVAPATERACKEVIEHWSGTYMDECAKQSQLPRLMTPAEIREQQRRADAAAKVIEATTPEM